MDLAAMAAGLKPMQDELRKAEAERAQAVVEGRAGGGAVVIALSGALEVKRVAIAPAAAGGDAAMLEDLVAAALGDALRQWRTRFGVGPEEQIQRLLAQSDLGRLLGPLAGALGQPR
jgi:DNA-binding YbaB/EbfC family protein